MTPARIAEIRARVQACENAAPMTMDSKYSFAHLHRCALADISELLAEVERLTQLQSAAPEASAPAEPAPVKLTPVQANALKCAKLSDSGEMFYLVEKFGATDMDTHAIPKKVLNGLIEKQMLIRGGKFDNLYYLRPEAVTLRAQLLAESSPLRESALPTRETRVINMSDAPQGWQADPEYVYIGRANPRKGLKASVWANPFKIDQDGTRDEVIAKYREYAQNQAVIRDMLPLLKGKTLVCYCKPLPCHADVLLELLAEATNGL